MNYDLLNKMIDYIEKHLVDDIDYKKLSKIVGVSDYSLQRIFVFLTGISISEYIRKRRLSKAFEELKSTNIKIIDLALKYHYDSSISFSRAFKKYFHITPTGCRNSKKAYQLFPIIKFQGDHYKNEFIHYEIKTIEKQTLYCFEVTAKEEEDLLYKIRALYRKLKNNDLRSLLGEEGMYGICIFGREEYRYCVGSKIKRKNTKALGYEDKPAKPRIIKKELVEIMEWYDEKYKKNKCFVKK